MQLVLALAACGRRAGDERARSLTATHPQEHPHLLAVLCFPLFLIVSVSALCLYGGPLSVNVDTPPLILPVRQPYEEVYVCAVYGIRSQSGPAGVVPLNAWNPTRKLTATTAQTDATTSP